MLKVLISEGYVIVTDASGDVILDCEVYELGCASTLDFLLTLAIKAGRVSVTETED